MVEIVLTTAAVPEMLYFPSVLSAPPPDLPLVGVPPTPPLILKSGTGGAQIMPRSNKLPDQGQPASKRLAIEACLGCDPSCCQQDV